MTILRACLHLPASNYFARSVYRASVYRANQWYSSAAAAAAAVAENERKPLFDKILIANRGEIACRVISTAKRLGIKTVAIYSEADAQAMHVKLADEAYLIGTAPASDSYLQADRIINVVNQSGAQAIHPGYGFLSENADFAEQLGKQGITFIGPPEAAMRAMGSKSESKRIMQEAGVPVVPGYHGENQDPEFLKQQADQIGYPVLIKAVLGGGGKGMRIVEKPQDFAMMLESSRREALKSFGDDNVLVEKYLTKPRHVEVQVFADKLGNVVHLFERDCSVQRRHQKIIEEAPAPDLLPEIRQQLGAKAVAAAKAVNSVGAGTVEFIMDDETQQFYFMEMNTRLQVENTVTEMVTSTDLVQWQLEVAAGNPLPKLQHEIHCTGHAFEARIYAENPDTGFLPDTGRIVHLSTPQPSADVRVETGVQQGDAISVFYDPMIAKLVVRGNDRREALRVLRKALDEYEVVGLHTNIAFLKRLAQSKDFIDGQVETGFINKHLEDLFPKANVPSNEAIALAALAYLIDSSTQAARATQFGLASPWSAVDSFRLNAFGMQTALLEYGDQQYSVQVLVLQPGVYTIRVMCEGKQVAEFTQVRSQWSPFAGSPSGGGQLQALLDRRLCRSNVVFSKESITVFDQGQMSVFSIPAPQFLDHTDKGAGSITTPMSCKIVQVLVNIGDEVEQDTPLVVLEAMKMEHVIKAPKAGQISDIFYKKGELVEEGKTLVAFTE
ncbi:hypothetical protein LPJ55_002210 [Coemansia sp. RSA 990]|nr:hypothetical protein LPJ55_002210 [Coemansia sp. RSA 990]